MAPEAIHQTKGHHMNDQINIHDLLDEISASVRKQFEDMRLNMGDEKTYSGALVAITELMKGIYAMGGPEMALKAQKHIGEMLDRLINDPA